MDPIESSRGDNPLVNFSEPSGNAKVSKRNWAPARDRLSNSVLLELWSIWRTNPRIPSIKSRRAWAISRDAAPRLVDNWFLRRGRTAKKAGETILKGPYELSLESHIVSEPPKPKRERCSPAPFDLLSDDTLFYPYGDELDRLETSSDTVWDDYAETKVIKSHAYTEVLTKEDCDITQQSFVDDHTLDDVPDEDIPSLVSDDPFLPVCNQGRGKQSDNKFTCVLCSKKPLKGIPQKNRGDLTKISCSTQDSHITSPQFLLLGVPPDTLMELSAIPFLFRTPTAVAPENRLSHQDTDSWMTLEDELSQLVKEGKLDFSFLDVPDLTAMNLPD